MNAVFADTYYYLALLSESDAAHATALQLSRTLSGTTVTTAWVLAEVADALASPVLRPLFLALYERLRANPHVTIVPPTAELFEQGVELYARRSDKAWSLTDCISFVVMEHCKLSDALTGDHHFEQAGFRPILG
jgi:predicted nucleic acid-binding protein